MSIDVKKWKPWNWFRGEQEQEGASAPLPAARDSFFSEFHRDFDRLFDRMVQQAGMLTPSLEHFPLRFGGGMLKPSVDIRESKTAYTIAAEIPGVTEKDIRLEIAHGALVLSGEKRKESEESDGHWHRSERSYGAFRRVLNLPEDADADQVEAQFAAGVLTITVARRQLAKGDDAKVISIRRAA
ncbi:MAG TPA: Hsp20/alpha crystallin family protein [Patescibacteria group bacterium]|nr:Hsp20/alpha crystallin family protein [Patescibacteria group bacterium]